MTPTERVRAAINATPYGYMMSCAQMRSAMSPDAQFLYVVNGTDGNVMKVDTQKNEVLLRIAVGVEPAAAVVFQMPAESLRMHIVLSILVAGVALGAGLLWLLRRPRPTH
jgi:hypothetical protein